MEEERKKKAKEIAEYMKLSTLPPFMARQVVKNNGSIARFEEDELVELVKKFMR